MAEIVPGELVQLTDLVVRVTAPNPGFMTGPGTNTYIVGRDSLTIIDPGPAIQSHIDAILNVGADRIHRILVTHTHQDHSPAATALAEATGAVVMGNPLLQDDGRQDDSFSPQHSFVHNEDVSSDQYTIKALLTPGHVGNHVCYLLEEEGMLFTGDHIMQGSTVVIVPPHGDMKDYFESLELLSDYDIRLIAPGHGTVIDTPQEEIQGLIQHRLTRESKVVEVISRVAKGSLATLTPLVYDDVDSSLHPVAEYSLWAHLIKLEKEQRVSHQGDEWIFKQ